MKKWMTSVMVAMVLAGAPMTSMPVLANDAQVEPQADVMEWRYKFENGVYYKRLYNLSRQRWEGPWIPMN
ncbi:hypothetical protein [Dubosiella muris]|uniref:Uncharacterized protein n=1 Tax=Dubosiella muris TaxID=3038133 RepID=A0AC61R4V3_9FIRM|nr:hypothetical protein [Dubosiella muris]TGY64571.1 hypothetical protein E5336_11935 [Dubosiella muris]